MGRSLENPRIGYSKARISIQLLTFITHPLRNYAFGGGFLECPFDLSNTSHLPPPKLENVSVLIKTPIQLNSAAQVVDLSREGINLCFSLLPPAYTIISRS